jgi:V8-like Glu-specific endopeptidase
MRYLILSVLLVMSCSHCRTTNQNEIMSSIRLRKEITVTLLDGNKLSLKFGCSGVSISEHTIMTAGHCVITPHELDGFIKAGLKVETKIVAFNYLNHELCTATPTKVDEKSDLALLKTECKLPDYANIKILDVQPGDQVQTSGYPGASITPILVDGYVTVMINKDDPDWGGMVVISTPIIGGQSGSPVWLDGAIVGIVAAGTQFHHDGLMVSLQTIKKFLVKQ